MSGGADDAKRGEVARRIEALPGVRGVDVGDGGEVTVRAEANRLRELSGAAIEALLKAELGVASGVQVQAPSGGGGRGTRVRFESLEVTHDEPGRLTARVELDWNGKAHVGSSSAESGPAGELRASGLATVRALGSVIGDEAAFSLVGIKEVHVFDHDIVAVILQSPRLPERRMIGLSIIAEGRDRAAVFAVLNATNRAVGSLNGSGGS